MKIILFQIDDGRPYDAPKQIEHNKSLPEVPKRPQLALRLSVFSEKQESRDDEEQWNGDLMQGTNNIR